MNSILERKKEREEKKTPFSSFYVHNFTQKESRDIFLDIANFSHLIYKCFNLINNISTYTLIGSCKNDTSVVSRADKRTISI